MSYRPSISRCPKRTLERAIRLTCRSWRRSGPVAIQGTGLGTGVVGLACAGGYRACRGAVAVARACRRRPGWLQVLLPPAAAGATAFVVFHRPTRARFRELARRAKPWLTEV